MRFRILSFCLLLVFLNFGSAFSQSPSKQPPNDEFMSMSDMYKITLKELEKANANLNVIFTNLISHFDDDVHEFQKKRLQDSQVAWLRYRDKNAGFEDSFRGGGTIQPLTNMSCKIRMTNNRIKELQKVIEDNPWLKE